MIIYPLHGILSLLSTSIYVARLLLPANCRSVTMTKTQATWEGDTAIPQENSILYPRNPSPHEIWSFRPMYNDLFLLTWRCASTSRSRVQKIPMRWDVPQKCRALRLEFGLKVLREAVTRPVLDFSHTAVAAGESRAHTYGQASSRLLTIS